MIKNERFATGLKEYLPYVKIIDQSKTSDQYFRLFDVPDKLYVGKNSFRIRVNRDTLVKGSLLYIDVIDSNGEVIFHEITELTGEDGSRLIVVHVYEDTPPGEATIYIAGRASYDVKNRKQLPYSTDPSTLTDFIDFPNLIWRGKVVVIPTDENENEIIFAKPPLVKVKERFEEYKTYASSESRRNDISGSFKVSINPIVSAYEYSDISKSGVKIPENGVQVILDPKIKDGEAQSRQEIIPQYSDLQTLYDANGNFTEDYKGGEIVIRNLTSQLNVAGVTVPDFSCSIIDVIDKNNVRIFPSFKFAYGERNDTVFKTIRDATNVTASYYTTTTPLATNDSESFIQLEFENLEPIAGKVDSVSLSYKPFGTFGEFVPIGNFRVKPQEYLIDSSSLVLSKTELIEREIGKPTGSADFDTYWELLPGKYNATYGVDESQFAGQGVTFKNTTTSSLDVDYDFKLKLKPDYGIDAVANTEFKLSFTLNLPTENSIRNTGDFQLDVFISGSGILRDTIENKDSVKLIDDLSEGERVSSLTKKTAGAVSTYTYYFKTLNSAKIYPVFAFNNAVYFNMKNISIQPRNEFGYSPNQARLFVPLETLKTNTELVLNVEYLTKSGARSKMTSQIYGLFFTGSGIGSRIIDDSLIKSDVFQNTSSSISDLSGSVSNISGSVSDLSGSVSDLSGSVSNISGSVSNLSGSFSSSLSNLSGSVSTSITNLSGSVSTSITNLSGSVNTSITNLSGSVSSSISNLSGSVNTSITNLSSSVSTSITNLSSSFSTSITNLSGSVSSSISNLSGSVSTNILNLSGSVSSSISNLSGSVNTSITNLSGSVSSSISNLSGSVSTNILNLSGSVSSSISNLSGSVNTSITNLSGSVSSSISNLSGSVNTRITTVSSSLDTKITTVSSSLDSKINFVNTDLSSSLTILSGSSEQLSGSFTTVSGSFSFVSESVSNTSIKTSGSSLYSFAPNTSGFSPDDGIFLGQWAGINATNAVESNFIGYNAGYFAAAAGQSNFLGANAGSNATSASRSNFIGFSAGNSATYATQSNFIGDNSGYLAHSASNSNFIGYYAGAGAISASNSNFIGYYAGINASSSSYSTYIGFRAGQSQASTLASPSRGNIVIGNSISVPYNSQNQINIGALIFGSGSYFPSNVNSDTIFSGSANGKIGINQPNPKYSFDVSGSGNYTNGLDVSGSTKTTGSLSHAGMFILSVNYRTSGASYTFTNSDYTVITASPNSIYLPSSSLSPGRICVVKNLIGIGNVTVYSAGPGEVIDDGGTTYTLPATEAVTFQAARNNWYIIGKG